MGDDVDLLLSRLAQRQRSQVLAPVAEPAEQRIRVVRVSRRTAEAEITALHAGADLASATAFTQEETPTPEVLTAKEAPRQEPKALSADDVAEAVVDAPVEEAAPVETLRQQILRAAARAAETAEDDEEGDDLSALSLPRAHQSPEEAQAEAFEETEIEPAEIARFEEDEDEEEGWTPDAGRLRIAPEPAPEPKIEAPAATEPAGPIRPVRPVRPSRPSQRGVGTPRPDRSRSASAIADLMARAQAESIEAPARPVRPTAGQRALSSTQSEDSVNRLMNQASSEMSDVDTRRRSETIAHLKAAVAATVADRSVPRNAPEENRGDELEAYRMDFAELARERVAKPEVVPAPEAPAERPQAQTPASNVTPLILVATQRVDRVETVAPTRPVAPMRSSRRDAAVRVEEVERVAPLRPQIAPVPHRDRTRVAEFLASLGHMEIGDRLEATGAWIMAHDREESFSQAEVFAMAGVDPSGAEREQAQIAFGILLRETRFLRKGRGRYIVAETSEAFADVEDFLN